jgi:glutathione S-transferase
MPIVAPGQMGPTSGQAVLYSFRRCPFAIRARMALLQGGVEVELREVALGNKPQALLDVSPKATVPVLVLANGTVIDQSLDIMRWALALSGANHWLEHANTPEQEALVALNDGLFKQALDAYKYPERHPEQTAQAHRSSGEQVLVAQLEERLKLNSFLAGQAAGFSDLAIFPFIRQWAAVDRAWFAESQWVHVRRWLEAWLVHQAFAVAMQKFSVWKPDETKTVFFFGKK